MRRLFLASSKAPLSGLEPSHKQIFVYLISAIVLVSLIALGLIIVVMGQTKNNDEVVIVASSPGVDSAEIESARGPTAPISNANVAWQQTETGWQVTGTPPDCPSPVFSSPVDLSKVTSILYPGQMRGGNYKPHGGLRFDTIADNQVTVRLPLDAAVVNGARYLVDGETQYTFDFVAPCGIMYRLGHLLTLSPEFKALAEQFPPAEEDDSRTTFVDPPVTVTAGEVLATAVGVTKGSNTFMDWGVYNLRTKNEISQDPAWAANHDPSLAPFAVCWFDLLPASDATRVKSLPAGDPTSGKTSDYCK